MKKKNKNLLFYFFGTIALICLVIFSAINSSSQTSHEADSLIKLISSAKDTSKVKLYLKLSDLYGNEDPKMGLKYANEASEEAKRSKNGKWIVKTQYQLFTILKAIGSAKRAYAVLDSTLMYIDTVKSNYELGTYFVQRGNISYSEGNYNEAAFNYLKSLRVFDDIKSDAGGARAYHGLGYAHQRMGNLDKAIQYYGKAIELYTKTGNIKNVATVNGNIGGIYVNRYEKSKSEKDFKMAFDYLYQAINSSITSKDKQLMGNNYNNMASLYAFAEDYKTAISFNEKAYTIREAGGLKPGMASSAGNLAQCYYLLNDFKKAEFYNSKQLELCGRN